MSDVILRKEGRAGRITLNRPDALNALTWDMCLKIERAIDGWAADPDVALLLIDATGDKAFCAGGDLIEMYETGTAGDFTYGERFWRDEYRMNAKLFHFPKPVVSLMQGHVLGGGVGVGCHGSHRVVCETSKIAMPEVSVGLVPDVGGSLLLSRAPGRLGEYLGLTGDRMDGNDAIYAGFADYFVPYEDWPALIEALVDTGDWSAVDRAANPTDTARLAGWQVHIDATFGGETFGDIIRAMPEDPPAPLAHGMDLMAGNSPLSLCCTIGLIRKVRGTDTIEGALMHEFRFTSRAMEYGDFLEGIRTRVIERGSTPNWRYDTWQTVSGAAVVRMGYPVEPPLDLIGDRP